MIGFINRDFKDNGEVDKYIQSKILILDSFSYNGYLENHDYGIDIEMDIGKPQWVIISAGRGGEGFDHTPVVPEDSYFPGGRGGEGDKAIIKMKYDNNYNKLQRIRIGMNSYRKIEDGFRILQRDYNYSSTGTDAIFMDQKLKGGMFGTDGNSFGPGYDAPTYNNPNLVFVNCSESEGRNIYRKLKNKGIDKNCLIIIYDESVLD